VLALTLFACRSSSKDVVVDTSVDQPFSQPVFAAFEKQTGIHVRAVYDTEETKSTGVVNRLIAEARRSDRGSRSQHDRAGRYARGAACTGCHAVHPRAGQRCRRACIVKYV
jgi:hypothetical protein